jgi:hypothetical protein
MFFLPSARRESSSIELQDLEWNSQDVSQLCYELRRRWSAAVVLNVINIGQPDCSTVFLLQLAANAFCVSPRSWRSSEIT